MAPPADRVTMEVHMLSQEILRLDTMAKQHITSINSKVESERELVEETKQTKDLCTSLRLKIEQLASLKSRLLSRAEQQKLLTDVERHERELQENTKLLQQAAISAKRRLADAVRNRLLDDSDEQCRETEQINLTEKAQQTTNKLSDLVARMAQQVVHSEQAMDSLVHSSTVLAQTHQEFDEQASHIQTGNRLLSKFERRELTDKIIIAIAVLMYLGIILYILQKRVLFWLF